MICIFRCIRFTFTNTPINFDDGKKYIIGIYYFDEILNESFLL